MPNTLNGINLAQVAQEGLDALLAEMFPFEAFVRDFSADVAAKGESVTSRVPSAYTAADASSGYATIDSTSTAKTVTLGNHTHVTVGFQHAEVSKGGYDLLRRTFLRPAIHAVVKKFFDDALALLTVANFGAGEGVGGDFTADDAATLHGTLTTAKVPKADRFVALNPTYFGTLLASDGVQAVQNYGSAEPIRQGIIPMIHGFRTYEYADMPSSESIIGFAGAPGGIIIASRIPSPPPPNWHGDFEVVQDPQTGLALLFMEWFDATLGQWKYTCTILHGVAVGVAGNIKLLTSAP